MYVNTYICMLIQVPEFSKLENVKSVLTGFKICQEYLP